MWWDTRDYDTKKSPEDCTDLVKNAYGETLPHENGIESRRAFEPRRPHSLSLQSAALTHHITTCFSRGGEKEMCWLSWKSIAIFLSFSALSGSESGGRVAGMRCGQGDMGRWQRAAAGIDLRSVTAAHSWKSALKCFATRILFFIFSCYSVTPTLRGPGPRTGLRATVKTEEVETLQIYGNQ